MIKIIKNGYVDFSHEVENNNRVIIQKRQGITTSWGAIIFDYKTAKKFERDFFDFVDNELEVSNVKKGDVLNLRDEKKICSTFSDIYDEYYLIINIVGDEITINNYSTVAQAVKEQKKMNNIAFSQNIINIKSP